MAGKSRKNKRKLRIIWPLTLVLVLLINANILVIINNQNLNPGVPTVGPSPIEPQINTMAQPNVEPINNQNINPEVPTVEPNLVEPQASPTTEENINADLQNLANDILNKPNE